MIQPTTYRIFIAIPLANRFRPVVSTWTEELSKAWHFKRWVHPADYHITLKYLGECSFQQVVQLKQALKEISESQSTFSLGIEGLGIFGLPNKPRILWAGVTGELTYLAQLQHKIEEQMEVLGFPREKRPYNPHLTLAKTYQGDAFPHDDLTNTLKIKEGLVTWNINDVVLYQSHLQREPMYQPLASFPFKG